MEGLCLPSLQQAVVSTVENRHASQAGGHPIRKTQARLSTPSDVLLNLLSLDQSSRPSTLGDRPTGLFTQHTHRQEETKQGPRLPWPLSSLLPTSNQSSTSRRYPIPNLPHPPFANNDLIPLAAHHPLTTVPSLFYLGSPLQRPVGAPIYARSRVLSSPLTHSLTCLPAWLGT